MGITSSIFNFEIIANRGNPAIDEFLRSNRRGKTIASNRAKSARKQQKFENCCSQSHYLLFPLDIKGSKFYETDASIKTLFLLFILDFFISL